MAFFDEANRKVLIISNINTSANNKINDNITNTNNNTNEHINIDDVNNSSYDK